MSCLLDPCMWNLDNAFIVSGWNRDKDLPLLAWSRSGQYQPPTLQPDGLTRLFGHTEMPDGSLVPRHPKGFRMCDSLWLKHQRDTLVGKIPPAEWFM